MLLLLLIEFRSHARGYTIFRLARMTLCTKADWQIPKPPVQVLKETKRHNASSKSLSHPAISMKCCMYMQVFWYFTCKAAIGILRTCVFKSLLQVYTNQQLAKNCTENTTLHHAGNHSTYFPNLKHCDFGI